MPLSAVSQALSGNYVIGSSQAAPFNTLTNAVNHINTVGISGAVTFLLDNATYSNATGETFPISINQITGTTATKTLTIKPNTGKTVAIQADNINGWTPLVAVIKLNGADNVLINGSNNGSDSKNLTISNTSDLTYAKRAVVWLANASTSNGANNNSISNVILQQEFTSGDLSAGIYAGGTSLDGAAATASNSNNTISNITVAKAGQGIYITGSATAASTSQNWTVSNSVFGASADSNKGFLGIYLNNVANFTLSNNTLNGFLKSTTEFNPLHAAIYMTGACSNGVVSGNKIDNVRETTGSSSTGIFITGTNISVHNNFINNVRANGNGGLANNGFGIYIHSGQTISIYNNTVRLTSAQSSGVSAALLISSGSGLNIRNNIFVNSQSSGATRYSVYSLAAASAFTNIDYNDYYSSQHVGYLGSNKPNLTQWKTATGKDAHSISISPSFTSATDLHIFAANSTTLDDLGTPISGISTDIDTETRSATTPDIGADEFESPKCPTSTTWNGLAWNNGNPTPTVKAIIAGNYDTSSGSLKACELVVNAGFTVTINGGQYIEVENDVTVNGNIVIEDKGALVQNDEYATHTGSITIKRKTAPMKQYDYTYWSAPVTAQALSVISPSSLYYAFNPLINNWAAQTAATIMTPGKGYIVRAPNNLNYATPQTIEAVFNGVPSTGDVAVPVVKGPGSFNLIGNPYPSAIDIDQFLIDTDNAPYIGGTVYLWTHNTAISMQNSGSSTFNYARDDYAKYNVTGGVKTATAAANSSAAPTGKIASGQGFFIEALQSGTHNIMFKNYMRTKGTNNNGQFFREDKKSVHTQNLFEKHRIWINISNTLDAYDEMLLGYIEGATNELDRVYDGKTFPAGNVVAIYSILDGTNLSIQGRALPFSESDIIPLGYVTAIPGTFTIALEDFDGLFTQQLVYLYDKNDQSYHDLKASEFNFETAAGTFNERFELRFTDTELGTHTPENISNGVLFVSADNQILVKSATNISAVSIYDLTGRLLYNKKDIASPEFTTDGLNVRKQAILVRVTLDSGQTISGKIMME